MVTKAMFQRSCWMACLVFVAGCGGSDVPKLAPVTGKVLAGGEPLQGGLVRFIPAPGSNLNSRETVTDSQGRYKIEFSQGNPGLQPGEYKVMFSRYQMPDGSPVPDQSREQDPKHPTALGAVQMISPEFEFGKAPECAVVVTDKANKFDFELPELKAQTAAVGNKGAARK